MNGIYQFSPFRGQIPCKEPFWDLRRLNKHLLRSHRAAKTELPTKLTLVTSNSLCYTIVLPGRKSGFRAGFRPDSSRERLKIGRPAGRRNQTYTRRFVLSAQTLCRSVTRAVTLTRKLRKKTVASAWPRLSRCTKRADATRIICLGASLLVFGCVKKHGANHT